MRLGKRLISLMLDVCGFALLQFLLSNGSICLFSVKRDEMKQIVTEYQRFLACKLFV